MRLCLALLALLAGALALGLGCAGARPSPARPSLTHPSPARPSPARPALPLVDASEGCARFWERLERGGADEGVKAFREELLAPHPDLYTPEVLGLPGDKPLDEALRERFEQFGTKFRPAPPRVAEVARALPAALAQADVSFRQTFPDFTPREPVYVVCSLGAFDGGTRAVKGHSALLFGPDVIAALRPPGFDLRPFLAHELFHVYHEQLHPHAPGTILWGLWKEGLATEVSAALNPGATHEELSVPDDLIAKTKPLLPRLGRALLEHLDDGSDSKHYGYFFYGPLDRTDVPARNGYVIGWTIAASLARTRSLSALAHATPREIRPPIVEALTALGPPPPP